MLNLNIFLDGRFGIFHLGSSLSRPLNLPSLPHFDSPAPEGSLSSYKLMKHYIFIEGISVSFFEIPLRVSSSGSNRPSEVRNNFNNFYSSYSYFNTFGDFVFQISILLHTNSWSIIKVYPTVTSARRWHHDFLLIQTCIIE